MELVLGVTEKTAVSIGKNDFEDLTVFIVATMGPKASLRYFISLTTVEGPRV